MLITGNSLQTNKTYIDDNKFTIIHKGRIKTIFTLYKAFRSYKPSSVTK